MELAEIVIKVIALLIFLAVSINLAKQDTYEKVVDGNKVKEKFTTKRKTVLILVWGLIVAILTYYALKLLSFIF